MYELRWSQVESVEIKGKATNFFGDNKAVAYNLLLAGKGRRELQAYVAQLIQERQIPAGRPVGVSSFELRRMCRNAKVRGWKLL